MDKFAIFFPQFQVCNVNDNAWGYGFTDWSLVAYSNAFSLWHQRRAPLAGFYDLSLNENIEMQFNVAAESGLNGFGVYHYFFDDGPLLNSVETFASKKILAADFKYFLIYANEPWSKRWAGDSITLLKSINPEPTKAEIIDHVDYLSDIINSPSYYEICKRKPFVFYRPDFYKSLDFVTEMYRDHFRRNGIDISLGYVVKNFNDIKFQKNFDFAYLFEPRLFFNSIGIRKLGLVHQAYSAIARNIPYSLTETLSKKFTRILAKKSIHSFDSFLSYTSSSQREEFCEAFKIPHQSVLSCGWDNTPRYSNFSTILELPTISQFKEEIINLSVRNSQIPILCNAWNEWSEGAAIEPCKYLGDNYLRSFVDLMV